MHGFLFCSDHPDCALLPQAQHIAAALPEHPLNGCMVPPEQPPGHIGLDGACKAAACILHAPSVPSRMLWLKASATESP